MGELSAERMAELRERVAEAIDTARYAHPDNPRTPDRPFSHADRSDREYALRLAKAAIAEFLLASSPPAGVREEWQPIETVPRDGTPVEVLSTKRPNKGDWKRADHEGWGHFEPSHWRTLPDPPAGETT